MRICKEKNDNKKLFNDLKKLVHYIRERVIINSTIRGHTISQKSENVPQNCNQPRPNAGHLSQHQSKILALVQGQNMQ